MKTMKFIDNIKIKLYVKLHNYLYYKISMLAIKLNNGISPKHRIMNYHQFFLNNIADNSKVLDIGCSFGLLSFELAEKAREVVAIDISKNAIEQAKRQYQKDNIKYINADATTYNYNQKFDFIILSNVLEHIKNRKDFLIKIKPFSKFFLIRVPMINRSWLVLYKKELGYEYRLDKTHFIEYTFKTFQDEMKSAGLKIINYSIQFGEIWAKLE